MEIYEVRQLVENYYDIQKIRIETFNRIVAFIRMNEKKIIEALSQKVNEIHLSHASHVNLETRPEDASHFKNETHTISASQINDETRDDNASHDYTEIQEKSASHLEPETRSIGASQKRDETHAPSASQEASETHFLRALKLLKEEKNEKKYAKFVKKYILSHGKNETQLRDTNHYRSETQVEPASHKEVETQEVGASHTELETHCADALSPFIKQIENLIWFHNKLYETEKELYKRLDVWSRNHPLRTKYLNYVKGIGPVLSSGIIAWYGEAILNAPNVSNIWKYSGLAPGQESQERRRGKKLNYNPKLKSFCWKIGQSFVRFKCFGRKLYDSFKEQTKQKHPDWTKGHIDNYARKKVVKLFISSVWEVWRRMNNLPVTKPYPIEFLGHKDIITPEMWMEKKKGDEDE
jgi:hypothetical protein